MRAISLGLSVLLGASMALADISGTATLSSGNFFNLDTGNTGTSGDFQWTGSAIVIQVGSSFFPFPGGGDTVYNNVLTTPLAFSALPYTPGGVQGATLPVATILPNTVIAFKTKGGNNAKIQVTSIAQGGSLAFKYTTYGATGGGGGGGGANGPTISSVQNNYGTIPQGLPNYGIAPSTLFFVQGTNLSTTTTELISSASPGLPTTRDGVTVTVTSGGTTLQCPLYYLSPTQIDAVLPGNTPLGTATITVTVNGATATSSINVVQSAFGILSYNGTLGATYDANNNLITAFNAANPNQTIVLWGSGVGSDPQDDDRLYPQKQNNLLNIPMQAFVGGQQAQIAYRGRSQFPGVDQVVITIPGSVSVGCNVSLAIVSGSIVSNSVTIPIAANGRTCSASGSDFPPELYNTLSGKTTLKTGFMGIFQTTTITSGVTNSTNSVFGTFQSVSGIAASSASNQVSIGSCLVYNSANGSSSATITGLDAGSAIAVSGPGGSLNLTPLNIPGLGAGFYSTANGSVPAGFLPATGGSFTFDNGSGGKDVQHFNAGLTMPSQAFTWTNATQISTLTRTSGGTVTWSGGVPGTYVSITGSSTASIGGRQVSVTFVCQAPLNAGTFTVPPSVLLALPAGTGSLSVGNTSNFQQFNAAGLDIGLTGSSNTTSKQVAYN